MKYFNIKNTVFYTSLLTNSALRLLPMP